MHVNDMLNKTRTNWPRKVRDLMLDSKGPRESRSGPTGSPDDL